MVDADLSGYSPLGGLVGWNEGTVDNSYATGNVSGTNGKTGGLVGYNYQGTVSNSYATGDLSGVHRVGGLVGYNVGGTVLNSYATGTANGESYVGGLVGDDAGGGSTVKNSFWVIITSGTDTSDGGTGKTTTEMKDVTTYTYTGTEGLDEPWNFVGNPNDDERDEDIWHIDDDEEINEGYPFFTWEDVDVELYELTVKVEGEGITDPLEGTHTYEKGTEVTVTATPDNMEWSFDEWTGDYEGTDNPTSITMDEDKVITAHFEKDMFTLVIVTEGGGSTFPPEGAHIYDRGTEVAVMAWAHKGWYFVEWTGDVPPEKSEIEITVTMNKNRDITAHFEEEDKPSFFEVDIANYDDEVVEGEKITVEYTVENIGELEGTQDILFYVDGTEIASESITLGSDEVSETKEFVWETEDGDAGEYTLRVESEDESEEVTVTVEETETHTLKIEVADVGDYSITSHDKEPTQNIYTFNDGENVTISYIATRGINFQHWEIDGEEIDNGTVEIEMTENKTLTLYAERAREDDDGIPRWILPLVAVVIALVLVVFFMKRKKDEDDEEDMSFEDLTAQQAPPPSAREETRTCPGCGQKLRYIEEYERWWCERCEEYR